MNRTIRIVIALACVVVLALPSAALAQTASEGGYGDDAAVLGQVQDPNGGGGNTASGGRLRPAPDDAQPARGLLARPPATAGRAKDQSNSGPGR